MRAITTSLNVRRAGLTTIPSSRWLITIIAAAVILRVGLAVALGNSLTETRGGTYDQVSYNALALRVVAGHGFSFATDAWPYSRANEPTAFWSYAYTLWLSAIYSLIGSVPIAARLIQAVVVGVLSPWFTFRIGRRVFGDRAGLIAASIAAVYLYFVTYAATLMTEALYIVGILWTIDVAMRVAVSGSPADRGPLPPSRRSPYVLGIELGLAMALTMLLRQLILVFWLIMLVWLLWSGRVTVGVRRLALTVAIALTTLCLVLAPFVIRNHSVFHRWTMPNTNAGFTFFWSNHPIYGSRFESVLSPAHGVSYQELIPPELRHLDEAALDRELLVRGVRFVQDDPGRYLRLSISRVPAYFRFWPTTESSWLSNASRVLSFGLALPFMLLGVVLALRSALGAEAQETGLGTSNSIRGSLVALLVLFVVVYSAIHIASWANIRYRLPVDAVLVVFAGYAVDRLLAFRESRREGLLQSA